jgi:hypothetical protein
MSTIPQRLFAPPCLQRWFLLPLLLFFVALSIQYSCKVHDNRSAFRRWQNQVLELSAGVDICERHNYPNPPIMALLLYPLANLPSMTGALTWFYLKAGLTLLALHWVFKLVASRERPFPAWARALAVVLSLHPMVGDLQHGNVNLFILFLVVAALTAYHRRRDFLSGIVLALAIACKVTPALFVPYFLYKRAWRTLAGCGAGLALFLWPGVVPALFLGLEEHTHQLTSWYKDMVHPFVVQGKVTSEHHNQSLPGLVARLATHSPSFSTYVGDQYTPTRYDNLLDLGAEQARWLVKGCMGLFALVVLVSCRTPTQQRDGWRLGAEFSLVILGMLLFSERTWKHHCVTLLLPFAILCYHLAACSSGRWLRSFVIASLALAFLLINATSTGLSADEAVGAAHSFGKQAQVYGAYVVAHVILLAALVALLHSREESTEPAPASYSVRNANGPWISQRRAFKIGRSRRSNLEPNVLPHHHGILTP